MTGQEDVSLETGRDQGVGFKLEVVAKVAIAERVVRLDLCSSEPLPAWTPGSHIELHLGDGLSRQYSLCGDPCDEQKWSVAVLLESEGRGGSHFVHDLLNVGDLVRATGPRNQFEFEAAERYIFIAGGIGITPILPMIRAADERGAEWRLIYGGRTEQSMAFREELLPYGSRTTICPFERCGHLDLATELADASDGTLIYCCGPEPLLQAVDEASRHWPTGALRIERFSASPLALGSEMDTPFEVELQTSQMTLTVPSGKSILEVAEDAGVWVPSSCQAGTCGTCETKVLAGSPDHRDEVLSDEEKAAGDYMMICVSRANSERLILEL